MLKDLIESFDQEINSLREFVELINPVVKGNTVNVLKSHGDAIMPLYHTVTKQSISDRQDELKEQLKVAKDPEEKSKLETKLKNGNNLLEKIEEELKSSESINVEVVELEEDGKGMRLNISGDLSQFELGMKEMAKAAEKVELLYRASFITLIGVCEFFISRLLHFYYDQYPDAAGIKEKSLSFSELKTFQTIKDAESYLLEKKVEQVIRGDFSSWISTLKKELKLNLGYLDELFEDLVECFQRRNIIVHAGGIVNSIYYSKVSDKFKEKINIGDNISPTEEYLEEKLWQVQIVFLLVAFELWKKLEKSNENRAELLINIAYDNLKPGKWTVAKGLSFFLMNDRNAPSVAITVATLNHWLTHKRLGQFDKVKGEVGKADFSDKSSVFRMALASLKEDKESFFKFLPQALKYEDLSLNGLFEYPIFEEMRETEEFKNYLVENNIQIPDIESEDEIEKTFNANNLVEESVEE